MWVKDDYNQIVSNNFIDHSSAKVDVKYDVFIGDPFRQRIGQPVKGTALVGNRSVSHTDNISLQTFVRAYGATLDAAWNNRGLENATGVPHCLDHRYLSDNACYRNQKGLFWD